MASLFAAGFMVALAIMVVAQLALMSVLDPDRADRAARNVSESRLTASLIDQTVRAALGPALDPALTNRIAAAASADPLVRGIVQNSLVEAHRQVVDPDRSAAATATSGNQAVETAIADFLERIGTQNGVDLSPFAAQVDTSEVVPSDLPDLGLRSVAERSRLIAAIAALLTATLATVTHPRPGRAVAGLGWRAAIVCGGWLAGLLVTGWLIGSIAETLFGELLSSVWSDSVPAMLGVLIAGLVLSVGIWLGGWSLDGMTTRSLGRPRSGYRSRGPHTQEGSSC